MESFIGDQLKEMKPIEHNAGYLCVKFRKDGRYHDFLMHRLMLETYVGPCPEGMEGCHKDGNKHNNDADNLYWGTRKQNMQDAIRHGVTTKGERNPQVKLNNEDLLDIVVMLNAGKMPKEIAVGYSLCTGTIQNIANGKCWSHITDGLLIRQNYGHWSNRPNAAEIAERSAAKHRGKTRRRT